ncbi:MAG: DNA polymerase III subunit chi [Steroidobacteraceae bacterium]|nr:DNA polymerase III subunit chi [Steroidobacteraceae bacterium]
MTGPAATKVDFYLLGAPDARARLVLACRVAEKAFDQGLRIAVRTAGPAQTAELDDLMWTFSDRSFLPHGVWPAEPEFAAATPVLIASGALPESHRDVLINLGDDLPADAGSYARVCEVIAGDEHSKRRARARWRGYRDAGLEPGAHNV